MSSFFTNTVGATPLVFSATGLPAGFTIDPVTGIISGNNPNDTLTYGVTVTATNNCGDTSQSFDMTFPCPAPTSTPIPNLNVPLLQGDPYNYNVAPYFTSPCGQTITFSAVGLPPGSSINPATGLISGTANLSQTWNVTVTATTICGQTSQSFTMDFSSN
ncbi:putative Ig domain-containing protein [Criblamydia sequanensis]|uniref:putative Ig domain-containing protein n=1 Tax=Candidatus Criblamydia sequanensis TaxID=340071 RepID=UPI001377A779|nr:putative Ig domain-containing protein [Criblamydia sequanensis]